MRYITRANFHLLIKGAVLLGTGGGGDPSYAYNLLSKALKRKKIKLVNISKLGDNDLVSTIFSIGDGRPLEIKMETIFTVKERLENLLGEKVRGIVPVEIGAGSIARAAYTSSILDIPLVDGDFVGGRASPEVYLETITLTNLQREPLVAVNRKGRFLELLSSRDYKETETVLRKFSEGSALVFGYPLRAGKIKNIIGSKTVSKTIKVGEALLSGNPVNNTCRITGGRVVFEGVVKSVRKKASGGFLTGKETINGIGKYGGMVLELFFKNENLFCKINGRIRFSAPDLILQLDKTNMEGIYNRELSVGQTVAIIIAPPLPIWRTKKGKALWEAVIKSGNAI